MTLLYGRPVARLVLDELAAKVKLLDIRGIKPCLAIILTTNEKHSIKITKQKQKTAEKAGIKIKLFHLETPSNESLLELIGSLNSSNEIHGVFIHLPLQNNLEEAEIVSAISSKKDVDGVTPYSLANLFLGKEAFFPSGVKAVFRLIEYYKIKLHDKNWVILGSTGYLSKPLANVLKFRNISYTFCNELTPSTITILRHADVIITTGLGKGVVEGSMVKDGALVIDFGNHYDGESVSGDIDYNSVRKKAKFITPVPGGVGPVIIAMLLENTVDAALQSLDTV